MAAPYELPFLIHPGMSEEARIRAIQRNFEHLAGMAHEVNRGFTVLNVAVQESQTARERVETEVEDYVADGQVPGSSPTPTVEGGPGYLAVSWDAITNGSPVTYEVHMSTTSGFTPSTSTKVAEVGGTRVFVRLDADGEPLLYETAYYVQLVAKDVDGSADPSTEASGELVQVSEADIAVDAVRANHILADDILAQKLAAVLIESNTFQTADDGQRVLINLDGVTAFDPLGLPSAQISTIGKHAFRGGLVADSLDVLGRMTLRGTDNIIDQGASVKMRDKTADPAGAPTVVFYNEVVETDSTEPLRGLSYDSTNTSFWTAYFDTAEDRFFIAEVDTDGSVIRTDQRNVNTTDVSGVVRVGSYVYVLAKRPHVLGTRWYLQKHDVGDLAFVGETNVTDLLDTLQDRPTLSTDGTNPIVLFRGSGGNINGQAYADTLLKSGSSFTIGTDSWGDGTQLYGAAKVTESGTAYWFVSVRGPGRSAPVIAVYNASTNASVPARTFSAGGSGIAHDGSIFWSSGGFNLLKWTNTLPGDVNLYVRYQYEDASDENTGPSPVTVVDMEADQGHNRRKVMVVAPPIPDDMDAVVFYAAYHASAEPTLYEQADVTTENATLPDTLLAVTAMPTVGSLTGTPAQFTTEDGSPLLRADGYIRCKVRQANTQSIGTGGNVVADMASADVSETISGMVVTASDRIEIPFAGEWLVIASARWGGASDSRQVQLQVSYASESHATWKDDPASQGLIGNGPAGV